MATECPAFRLRPLTPVDKTAIANWPPYPEAFADLDYALRPGGWLDEFSGRQRTWLYAAEQSGELVAFGILSETEAGEAEFRIALHPEQGGRGLGGVVASHMLDRAFTEIGMRRVHLVVRKNNPRAIRLYQRLGFAHRGECRLVVNRQPVDFFRMELLGTHWQREA